LINCPVESRGAYSGLVLNVAFLVYLHEGRDVDFNVMIFLYKFTSFPQRKCIMLLQHLLTADHVFEIFKVHSFSILDLKYRSILNSDDFSLSFESIIEPLEFFLKVKDGCFL
jgi:hypothetical protein